MSKQLHTPGPWSLNGFYIDLDIATRIATVSNWRMSGADAFAEASANARLIASAPELLEALELAVSEYEKLPHSLGYEFTHLPAMRAAIAKAKGEQA